MIGALRPTNTWDFYTYIVFALIALFYSIVRHYRPRWKLRIKGGAWIEKLGVALLICLGFVLLSFLLYQPFTHWYRQGYTQIDTWKGDRTPLSSYFTHWGLFLFIIISWMGWETYQWMKTTPISTLTHLKEASVVDLRRIDFLLDYPVYFLDRGDRCGSGCAAFRNLGSVINAA